MRMPRFTLGMVSCAARLLQDCGMGRARIRGSLVLAQAKHKEAGERLGRYTAAAEHRIAAWVEEEYWPGTKISR